MINRILLGKYRVLEIEIDDAAEVAGTPLVYRGCDIDSHQRVVIELVPLTSLKPLLRKQLESEAIIAKQLDHTNIARLLDFGIEEDHFVYVTEEVAGTAVAEWVTMHGPLAAGPVLRIATQVIGALDTAAAHGLPHRAINPDNLMLVPGQIAEEEWPLVKVLHFVGIAPKVSGDDGAVAAFDTSLHYASPEQIRGCEVDLRSEIFSLGATLWFLLTGVPPMVAPKGAKVVVPLMPGGIVRGIPRRVLRLLAQMLSADLDERPASLAELQRRLDDCQTRVSRREAMPRGVGSAAIFQNPARAPFGRARLLGTLALTVLLAATSALAVVALPRYLKHRRIIRGEEPIGVPIGVATADSAVGPGPATSTAPIAANSPPASSVMTSATWPPSQSIGDTSKGVSSPTQGAESVANATTEDAKPPASDVAQAGSPSPAIPSSMPNVQSTPDTAIAATGDNSSQQAVVEHTDADRSHQPVDGAQPAPENNIAEHEVRRALPVKPNAREPEADSPGEGPVEASPEKSGSTQQRDSVAQDNGNLPVDSNQESSSVVKPRDSKPRISSRARDSSERKVRHRRRMVTRIYPDGTVRRFAEPIAPSQRRIRGRVVGMTPDGRWLVLLPSNEVIAVPPRR